MYTYEQKITEVKLYIKYCQKAAPVIRELGYPNRHVLVQWFKEYEATGDLHQKSWHKKNFYPYFPRRFRIATAGNREQLQERGL